MIESAIIRRALPEEARAITALTLRSKAHWGYDDAFMAIAEADLAFRAENFLPEFHVYILEQDGRPLGFCGLIPRDAGEIELHDLFVDPPFIGKGCGKLLWDHAICVARNLGFSRMTLTADPHAVPFYERQGAVHIGTKPSTIDSARLLPVMQFLLP